MPARSHTEDLAKPRLIIFDWDGTLFNSEPAVINAHQQARSIMNLPPLQASTAEALLGLGKDAACHLATLGTNIAPSSTTRHSVAHINSKKVIWISFLKYEKY